jgi:predicted RNA binding protein YcfA (HicA-like mRNA interferase family)
MSQRLPSLKPREVLRALERAGFALHHVSGSHYVLKHSQKTHLRVTLPWHNKDLRRGTLRSIIEQAGFTVSEFLTPAEAKKLRHALKQVREGKTKPWSQVKHELGL